LIPSVIDRINLGLVRARKISAKLKIVRRIRENEIYRSFRELQKLLDAIAYDDAIVFESGKVRLMS